MNQIKFEDTQVPKRPKIRFVNMKVADVKFLKMTRRDYADGATVGVPIQNFPEWRVWSEKYWGMGVSRKMFDKGCNISGDNRAKFKKHFGKCAFTFNGNNYFHGWLADLGAAQVIVLTAREKGTCYEVLVRRDGVEVKHDIPKVLSFLDMVTGLQE
jgi:hypothetical protein